MQSELWKTRQKWLPRAPDHCIDSYALTCEGRGRHIDSLFREKVIKRWKAGARVLMRIFATAKWTARALSGRCRYGPPSHVGCVLLAWHGTKHRISPAPERKWWRQGV